MPAARQSRFDGIPRIGASIASAAERGTEDMTFAVHGLPVARGIAIGRAVLVVSSRIDVAHYFIKPEEI